MDELDREPIPVAPGQMGFDLAPEVPQEGRVTEEGWKPWTGVDGKPVRRQYEGDWDDQAYAAQVSELPPGVIPPTLPPIEDNVTPAVMGFEVRVAPDLLPLVKPVGLFQLHPHNARKHNLQKIAGSLTEFGQQTPIVVQKSTGYICKGNGTYEAATKILGATRLAVSVEDFDDDTAYRYLLADNRASDLAEYDRDQLLANLERLLDGPRGLQGTLWDADAVDDYRGATIIEPAPFEGGYNEDPEHRAARAEAAASPGAKLKEVPLNMTLEDHARFMGWIATLKEAYGTTGTIATIYEAVRREAALWVSGPTLRGLEAEGAAVDQPGFEPVEQPTDLSVTDPEPTEEELLARLLD